MKAKIFTKKNVIISFIILFIIIGLAVIIRLKNFNFNFGAYDDIEIVSFDAWYPYGEKGEESKEEKTKILPVSGEARRKILELFDRYSYGKVKDVGYTKMERRMVIVRTKIKLRDKGMNYHYYDVYVSDLNKMEIWNPDTNERSFYIPKGTRVMDIYSGLMNIVEQDK